MRKTIGILSLIMLLPACDQQDGNPAGEHLQEPVELNRATSESPPPIEALVTSLRKFLPRGWDIVETSYGQVEPVRWLEGRGWHIHMKRTTSAPNDYWKRGRKGKVKLWIMDRGYKPRRERYADMPAGSGPNVGPAREVGRWHGRRVLIWGGASDWEDWESDLLYVLDLTAQPVTTPTAPEEK